MVTKLKRPKRHYPLVEIWWLDTTAMDNGWKSKVEQVDPVLVTSVGFLVAEDPEHYIIAMDVAPDKEHNQRSQIPRGMVKYFKILRKQDEEKAKVIPS